MAVVAALAMAGCALGPDYKRPDTVDATRFKEAPPGWQTARPADELPRGQWWKSLGDAELDRLIDQLHAANQDLRAAEAAWRQASALGRQARAQLWPVVGAGASSTRARSNGSTATTHAVTGTLDWELDLWGGIRRGAEAGEAGAQASQATLASTQLSLEAELATNYFALRIADAQRAIYAETIAAYERSLQLTRNRYAAGVITRADVSATETQLLSTQAAAIDIGVTRAQLEHAIALLVGRAPADFNLPARTEALSAPGAPPTLAASLLERRPDIAAAERRVAQANAQIGVAQAAFFPTLSIGASGGWRGLGASDLFTAPNRVWSLGAALAATLFDGGQRSAAKDAAVAAYDQQVAAYRQTVLTALGEVEDNLVALRLLADEAEVQGRAVAAAQDTLALVTNQYKAGTASYLEVISAQTAELNTRRSALDITGRRYAATVALIRALGGGWEASTLAAAGR